MNVSVNRGGKLAATFLVGSAVGVAVGYCVSIVLIYSYGTYAFEANAIGYGVGFCANFATQLTTRTIRLDHEQS